MSVQDTMNDQLVLISGLSATGKSASLQRIRNQERWMYLNTESGKRLPFKNNYMNGGFRITDPYQILEAFDHAINNIPNQVDGIIIDSLTFLMDMYETMYIIPATDGRAAWSNYQHFFKQIMQDRVPRLEKPVIITAHVREEHDEQASQFKTSVPIKGALKNNGVEAYFSTVVSAKKMQIRDLDPYANSMLKITEDDEMLGYKHVFQTRPTKTTTGERMRSPMGMFTREETFIDNDAQMLLDHLKDFYSN